MSQDIVFVKSDRAAQPEKKGDHWVVSAYDDIKVLKGDFTVVDTGIEKRGDADVEWEWEVVQPWQTMLRATLPFTPITHTCNECVALINTSDGDVHIPKWSQYIKWGLKSTAPTPVSAVEETTVEEEMPARLTPVVDNVDEPIPPTPVIDTVKENTPSAPVADTVEENTPCAPVVTNVEENTPSAPVVTNVEENTPCEPMADTVKENTPSATVVATAVDHTPVVDAKPKRKYIRKTKKDEPAPSSSA